MVTQLDKLSRRIYRALGLTGYARMDFRVSAEGQVYVLEANANPNLEAEEDFAESARAAGIAYDDLLGRLMALGHVLPGRVASVLRVSRWNVKHACG